MSAALEVTCPVCGAVPGQPCHADYRRAPHLTTPHTAPVPPAVHAARMEGIDHDGENGPAGEVPPASYVRPALDLGIADTRALDDVHGAVMAYYGAGEAASVDAFLTSLVEILQGAGREVFP